MKLLVDRKYKKDTYTISRLFVDGKYFCDVLEDKDRGLKQTDRIDHIKQVKVYGETAIPSGTYEVTLDVTSPKYSASAFYREVCNGRVPRLLDVPGFSGVLIHVGNSALDSSGCLLVGRNTLKGRITASKATFKALYAVMGAAHKKGEKITIEIL